MRPALFLLPLLLLGQLLPGVASACSILFVPTMLPEFMQPSELTQDALIYLPEGEEANLSSQVGEIRDPAGDLVSWEFVDVDFSTRVVGARPVGGWILGDYTEGPAESPVLFHEVVAPIDSEPPLVSVASWSGQSPALPRPDFVDTCGSSSVSRQAGVAVSLDEPGEPTVYLVDVVFEGGDEEDPATLVFFDNHFFIPTPHGSRVSLTVEGFDLAGNSSTVELGEVRGCQGAQGSLAAGQSVGLLGLLAMLAFCSGSLRRHERAPSRGD